MNPEIFAEWFRRQGRRVVKTDSSYWVEAGSRVFQAFPYHWIISPSQNELDDLFHQQGAIALRYSTLFNASVGAPSYHVVFTEREYPISGLPKKTRPDVRRAMERASVVRTSFERLADEGWQLRADTLQRQGRDGAESPEWWKRMCLSARDLPGFEAWAALEDGHLAATLIAFTYEDCCNALYQQSRTEYLPLGVNNALTFWFTQETLKRPGNPWIFYGLHSLDAPASVDEFKFHMRYRAKAVKQRVVFNPLVRPLVNQVSYAILRLGHEALPRNTILAKGEGMFRFHLQGKLRMHHQVIPEQLREDPGLGA